jgi:hypothetical protein
MWAMAGATGCPKIKLGFRISVWDLPPLRLEEVSGGGRGGRDGAGVSEEEDVR